MSDFIEDGMHPRNPLSCATSLCSYESRKFSWDRHAYHRIYIKMKKNTLGPQGLSTVSLNKSLHLSPRDPF